MTVSSQKLLIYSLPSLFFSLECTRCVQKRRPTNLHRARDWLTASSDWESAESMWHKEMCASIWRLKAARHADVSLPCLYLLLCCSQWPWPDALMWSWSRGAAQRLRTPSQEGQVKYWKYADCAATVCEQVKQSTNFIKRVRCFSFNGCTSSWWSLICGNRN